MPLPEDPLGKALGGFINDTARGVVGGAKRYRALPPLEKNLYRCSVGAGLVVFCLYLAFYGDKGLSGQQLASALARSTEAPPWLPFAVWAALLGFGVLWCMVGVRSAGDARDSMRAFWSGLLTAGFGGLLWWQRQPYPPADLLGFLLQGFFVANVAGWGLRFWLSVRNPEGPDLEAIRRQRAHGRARQATEAETAARLREGGEARPRRQFRD